MRILFSILSSMVLISCSALQPEFEQPDKKGELSDNGEPEEHDEPEIDPLKCGDTVDFALASEESASMEAQYGGMTIFLHDGADLTFDPEGGGGHEFYVSDGATLSVAASGGGSFTYYIAAGGEATHEGGGGGGHIAFVEVGGSISGVSNVTNVADVNTHVSAPFSPCVGDPDRPTAGFVKWDVTSEAESGPLIAEVVLSHASDTDVEIPFEVDILAVEENSNDYSFESNSVLIPAGETRGEIVMTIVEDNIIEGEQWVGIKLLLSPDAIIPDRSYFDFIITDDD